LYNIFSDDFVKKADLKYLFAQLLFSAADA